MKNAPHPRSSIEVLEARIAPAFAPIFELSSLNGLNGFAVSGAGQQGHFARAVSDAGDVNGDGIGDLIVGAYQDDFRGSSYVIFGSASGFSANVNVSELNGTNGFRLSGVTNGELSGVSVSAAGDVNGDGFGDLIIGAFSPDESPGASYVVFGKASGFAATLSLSTLDGSNGFKIGGDKVGDRAGHSVSGAGDVNGDGFDDLIIGAYRAEPNGFRSGASYVVFGKGSGFAANLSLSTLTGTNGFKLSGADGEVSGKSVSHAGDVNGDGFEDVIIGAFGSDPGGRINSGASYVVFGKASGFAANLNLSALNGSNGFKLSGVAAGDFSGYSVSDAGDVNGDGFDDVIIGAYRAEPNGPVSGASYVVFGKASGFAANLNLSALNGSNGFKLSGVAAGDASGKSVSGAGDVNGDSFDDVIVGADRASPNGRYSGASYVVFGKASAYPAILGLATLNGIDGFKLNGIGEADSSGNSVSAAGDVNGDGVDDLIVGAHIAPNRSAQGVCYVVFGRNVSLTISDAAVSEGGAGTTPLEFTVSLSEASTAPVRVQLATVNGSALADSDFVPLAETTLTFAPGETSKVVIVGVNGDSRFEGDENFSVVLSAATGGIIQDSTGMGMILNDDAPPVVSISDASRLEGYLGTSEMTFAVSLSAASELPATVSFATRDGTAVAGSDYTVLAPGALTFAPGETVKTIAVEVFGDTDIEGHEGFSLVLSEPTGATIGTGTATGTILNDDTAIRIVGPTERLEGDADASPSGFTIGLEKASALPVTVRYATVAGSATPGSDFVASEDAQLTFEPGETTKRIDVEVLGDTEIENHETFAVVLSAPTNATLAERTASSTILNDDTALRISNASTLEGDEGKSPLGFTISLEKPSAIPVTVSYATADGTAAADTDYEPVVPTQLTFAPGETSKTVNVEVLGDTEVEAHEIFSVVLSEVANAAIATGTATATILNDDTLIRISNQSLLEGHAGTRAMSFTVSLNASSALPVSVNFASVNGNATAGIDYTSLTLGTLEFAHGETNKTLTVEVLGDTAVEASETFTVLLSNSANAVIADGTGLGTILDDDVTLVGPRKATFTDVDGELVTIKVSKGTLKVEDFTIFPAGQGAQLALIDLSGEAGFSGADLKITSKKIPGAEVSDGVVNVGYINGTGIDLGKVKVKGDLGQIDAGDGDAAKSALKTLSVASLGARGLSTQEDAATASLHGDIAGDLRKLKVKTDIATGVVIALSGRLGSASIGGNLDAATISALGLLNPAKAADALAIGGLSIGGNISASRILAGYDLTGAAINADVGIGSLKVGGDWRASDLVAGVAAGSDGFFGTEDDTLISGGNPIIARIASVVIKGTAAGTEGGTDHFGFVTQEIAAFKAGAVRPPLTPGPSNDLTGVLVGSTGDLRVREVT